MQFVVSVYALSRKSELLDFGLCPLYGIIKTREHDVLETVCFSPHVKGETHSLLDPLERTNRNHVITCQYNYSYVNT
jgi:hypothetical protein